AARPPAGRTNPFGVRKAGHEQQHEVEISSNGLPAKPSWAVLRGRFRLVRYLVASGITALWRHVGNVPPQNWYLPLNQDRFGNLSPTRTAISPVFPPDPPDFS